MRCQVMGLSARELRYQIAIAFNRPLDLLDEEGYSNGRPATVPCASWALKSTSSSEIRTRRWRATAASETRSVPAPLLEWEVGRENDRFLFITPNGCKEGSLLRSDGLRACERL